MELAWWPNSLVSTAPPVILIARDAKSPIKKSARATRSTALATAMACILGGLLTVSESFAVLPTCYSSAPPAFLILSLPSCIYISSAVTGSLLPVWRFLYFRLTATAINRGKQHLPYMFLVKAVFDTLILSIYLFFMWICKLIYTKLYVLYVTFALRQTRYSRWRGEVI